MRIISEVHLEFRAKQETDLKKTYEVLKLSFVKKNNDLYIIDKSYDNFRISIHKDGSVWFCPQKGLFNRHKKIKLFQFSWDLLSNEPNKEKPFCFYIPALCDKYPLVEKYKINHVMYLVFNQEKLENQLIKMFFINPDEKNPLIKTVDSGTIMREVKETKDGQVSFKQDQPMNNPFFCFEKHTIRFGTANINKTGILEKNNYRILILCQPYSIINIHEYFKQRPMIVDEELIKKNGFMINEGKYNDCEMRFIIY